jgi:hypothetical protein
MIWKTVRLELASTDEYPLGSAGRVFLLHVPIGADGCIDRLAIDRHPERATVRRFWGAEADSFGLVEPKDGSWALNCARGRNEKSTFLLESVPLRLNGRVIMREAKGSPLPFRVASVRSASQR